MMTQLRQTLRRLARAPGFTLTTLATLAIGIGATTAIFSVVNGILIKPLPFPQADRLIALTHRDRSAPEDGPVSQASPAIYFAYRDNNRAFESVALWSSNAATVTGVGDPEEVLAVSATQEFLPTLRVTPMLGRPFTAADDEPGNPRTVMLSHTYWERRFGAANDVVGRTLTIDDQPHEVIGVLPATFRFLEQQADVLIPGQLVRATAFVGPIGQRGIARMKHGVTLADASADIERMIPIMIETFPRAPWVSPEAVGRLAPDPRLLQDLVVGDLADVLWVLMGTIGILLLIACANVANLELVRHEARVQELAIRTALGAGWAALARSLLLESLVCALVGGALGLALAVLALPAVLAVSAGQLPSALDIRIDSTVLTFTFVVSLASVLLFGLFPLARLGGPRALAALRGAAHAYGTSRERHRARNTLLVAQVALALVLLVAAGLMIRTFQALRDVDPGIRTPAQVQVVRLAIPQRPASGVTVPRMQNEIEDRLAEVAGVESVGFSNRLPLIRSGPSGPFVFENAPDASPRETEFRNASPGFARTLGTPLVAGRHLEWADTYERRPTALVSQNLANERWGSAAAALGQRLRIAGPNPAWLEVVGVVGDIRHNGLEQPAPAVVYFPQNEANAQFASRVVFFFVRSERVGTPGFIEELERAIWSIDPALPLGSVQTLGEVYQRSMARTALTLVLLAITSGMALTLGLVGIYGVVSYMLSRRTHEIGIRMALGAQHGALKRMLLTQVLTLIGIGVALGLGGAAALTRLMSSLLFGVTALDPVTYVGVAALLVSAGLLAAYLPARRVTRVDPMQALRTE
jgi:putative ABC transport system permease protein